LGSPSDAIVGNDVIVTENLEVTCRLKSLE